MQQKRIGGGAGRRNGKKQESRSEWTRDVRGRSKSVATQLQLPENEKVE